jgi:DNA repair protein RecN (Recombination protein N)
MLRLLSIRNFVVVDALDLELDRGFSVLTGETGAGKSILLDALALLLGDRFETRQLKPGADRAELAASFDIGEREEIQEWLADEGLAGDDGTLIVRRTLDAMGRSRAWINGRPATLAQLAAVGERLVDLHGQHEHQSLVTAEAQRALVDAFGGFTALTRETAVAWRAWREAVEHRDAAAQAAQASAAERESLEARARELTALGVTAQEWASLAQTHSRLAHAASLIEAAAAGEEELIEADASVVRRLGSQTTTR